MIPLVGCRVAIASGKNRDKEGVVSRVEDYRLRLMSLSEREASLFVRGQKARLGGTWAERWFHAAVELDSGEQVEVGPGDLRVLTPEMVRSDGYKSV